MRFFEYESRQIVKAAGIPVSPHGFARTPQEARSIRGRHLLGHYVQLRGDGHSHLDQQHTAIQ